MPLTLTNQLDIVIAIHEIKSIVIDVENNLFTISISDQDISTNEIRRRYFNMAIFDDLQAVIEPGAWSENNPDGNEMYSLIKEFIFMRLQELPGENGLGAGTIT